MRLALAPRFSAGAIEASSVLRQAGIEVASVRVVIARTSNGDELFNRTIAVAPGQTSITLEAEVLLRSIEEELTAFMEFLDATGTVLYRGEQRVIARAGTNTAVTVDAEIDFVGPGATAATVRVTPADTTISTSTPLALSAVAADASGAPIASPILLWTSGDVTLATVSTTGVVTPVGPRGAVQVTARTPLGITGVATIRLMPPPVRMVLVGGGGQSAAAGTTLPQPFTVEVQAADGLPVPGQTVTFSAVTAGGSVAAATATTDAQGRASTPVKVGTAAGRYEFRAVTGSIGAVTIEATASPAAASTLAILSGDAQSAPAGSALAAPLVAKVRDAFGNLVAGATVTWQVTSGSGTLASVSSVSDASGHASVAYTVGNTPGAETIKATLTGTSATVTFTATATTGAPATIMIVSGDAQTGDEGSMLASPLVVLVKDAVGNPVPGAAVVWSVTTANAAVAQATSLTDANAKTSNTVTLGSPAVMPAAVSVTATIAGGVSVTFGATIVALPPVAAQLKVVTQPATAAVGATMTPPLSVRIADAAGVAIAQPGVAVTASVYAPSASVLPMERGGVSSVTATMRELVGTTTVTTDAAGTAAFGDLALMGSAGEVQVAFSASGLAGVVSSSITLVAGTPVAISRVSGDGQSGEEGTTLAQPLVVAVVDASGNPTAGVPVTWTVPEGSATVAQASTPTDAAAQASNIVSLGHPESFPATVSIAAAISSGATTTFTATITAAPLVPAKLVITQEPSAGEVGVTLSPPYRLQVADASGVAVSQAGIAVEAALFQPMLAIMPADSLPRRGARVMAESERTLTGTVSVITDAAGVATFSDLSVTGPSGPVELQFTAPELEPVTSSSLPLTAGPLAALVVRPAAPEGPLNTTAGSPLQDDLWVATVDASGNPVPRTPLAFSVRTGSPDGAEFQSAANESDSAGTFHASRFPVPSQPGTYYIRFSVPQTAIPVVVIGVNVAPPPSPSLTPVPLVFDPVKDTVLTQEQLTVVLKDAGGVPIAGASITWRLPVLMTTEGLRAGVAGTGTVIPSGSAQPAFSGSTFEGVQYQSGFLVAGNVESTAVTTTGADGSATVTFHRGITAGVVGVTAEATELGLTANHPVDIAPGSPVLLRMETTPSLSARAGVVLAQQPAVSLGDTWGNAVETQGVPISAYAYGFYRYSSLGAALGSVTDGTTASASSSCVDCEGQQYLIGTTTVNTDAAGLATYVDLAIGAPVGSYRILFMNEELGLSVSYPAGCEVECYESPIELTAGPAAKWIIEAPTEAPVGSTVQLLAGLEDGWRNPIVDGLPRDVTWKAVPEGIFTQTVQAEGDTVRVSAAFTVSEIPGSDHGITLSHVEGGSEISGSATITAYQSVIASSVQVLGGSDQVVPPATPLEPLTVRVLDASGMPVPSATVRWSARRYVSWDDYYDHTYQVTSLTGPDGVATSPELVLPQLQGRTGFVIRAQVVGGGESSPSTVFRAVTRLPGYTHVWMGPRIGTYDGTPGWSTASLWKDGSVPTASSNVLIPDFYSGDWSYPTMTSSLTVNDLHSHSTYDAPIDIGANTLTIAGSMRASTVYGTGSVVLEGMGKTAQLYLYDGTLRVGSAADVALNGTVVANRIVVNGRLDLADQSMQVYDTLKVEGAAGRLVMRHRDAGVWARHMIFDGAATEGNLSSGYLEFNGVFEQRNTHSPAAFAPGDAFRAYSYSYSSTDTTTVSFASTGAGGSHFSSMTQWSGVSRQLSPARVSKELYISGEWHTADLTAEYVSVEPGGKLYIGGSANAIRRLTLEPQSTLNTLRYGGSLTVDQCENYDAVLEPEDAVTCSGFSSLVNSMMSDNPEASSEAQPVPERRAPPMDPRVRPGARAPGPRQQ